LKTSSNQSALSHARAGFAAVTLPLALAMLSGTVFASTAQPKAGSPDAGMMRFPAISKDHIAFVFADDIYVVPKAGGQAVPLATASGPEQFPRFSPDGKTLAFQGVYDGRGDLYTMPVAGGVPNRVTHHPAGESLAGWTPDGKELMFLTNAFHGLGRVTQLWSVPAEGGAYKKLAPAYAGYGAMSPDGKTMVFTTHSTDTRTWKRYRGGMATDLWSLDLIGGGSKRLTDWEGTDTIPMFAPASSTVAYYLSDQGPEHRLNIWSVDLVSGQRTQITKQAADDIRWPSIGPGEDGKGEIIFQLGSELKVLSLADNSERVVNVTIPNAQPNLRTRSVDASRTMQGVELSPTGKRMVIGARGEIFTMPAKEGAVRNLSNTDNVFERTPTWSPDGKWIAYFSDESGEYELYVRPSDAKPAKDEKKADEAKADEKKDGEEAKPAFEMPAAPRKLTSFGEGFRTYAVWSPNSKHLVVGDNAGRWHLVNAETGETKLIDQDGYSSARAPSWSHDSAWIAYAREDEGNGHTAIWLYEVASGTKTRVTSPMFNSVSPAFDRKGDFLYFISGRTINQPDYSPLDTTFIYNDVEKVYGVPLRKDVKNPFALENDVETIKPDKKDDKKDEKKEDKKDEAAKAEGEKKDDAPKADGEKKDESKKDEAKKPDAKKEKDPIKIDLDGFEARAFELPIRNGQLGGLMVQGDNKLIYVRVEDAGFDEDDEPLPGGKIMFFDPAADEKDRKEKVVTDGIGYDLSADGKTLLIFRPGGRNFLGEPKPGTKPEAVNISDLMMTIRPREEWNQILKEVFRLHRDYFYEPTLHGVNWKKVYERYAAMLPFAASRSDVNFIITEMISELNIGHAYLSAPGDVQMAPPVRAGLLGCDFELVSDGATKAYKITKLYRGAKWDTDARNPLEVAGSEVKEGEFLLAINGRPLDTSKDPYASLLGMAGKTVVLTVSSKPTIDSSARDVLVQPIESEEGLRYRAWIEANRKFVEEKSGGKIGYIYVPNTGVDGQNNLFRQFFGQRHLDGLIIDERWNGGGQIPTRFIELLNRPVTNYWAVRHGTDWTWPPDSAQGHKAMLVNGLAGSGGDMFPWLFKHNKLGPVIGTRTWGGLVGISGNPGLIDGGAISVPTFGFYETDGTWGVEGHGVDPDIEVWDDPAMTSKGQDPQLDRAIAEVSKAIEAKPYKRPARPQSPNRSGMGIAPADK
jgi:tricorn protease